MTVPRAPVYLVPTSPRIQRSNSLTDRHLPIISGNKDLIVCSQQNAARHGRRVMDYEVISSLLPMHFSRLLYHGLDICTMLQRVSPQYKQGQSPPSAHDLLSLLLASIVRACCQAHFKRAGRGSVRSSSWPNTMATTVASYTVCRFDEPRCMRRMRGCARPGA